MKRKTLALLAGVVCLMLLWGSGASWSADTEPTVVFNAGTQKFSFLNCTEYSYGGTERYPDLFPGLKNVMPGDSFTQTIRVKVIGAYSDTVKMYLRSESPNADYERLLGAADSPAALTATFGDVGAERVSVTEKAKDFILGKKDKTITDSNSTTVYLGAFTGKEKERAVELSFSLDKSAGNEYADLQAAVDWVFLAEIIPDDDDDIGGGGSGGGGSSGGGGGSSGGGSSGSGEVPVTPPENPPVVNPPEYPPVIPPLDEIPKPYAHEDSLGNWQYTFAEYHQAYIIGREDGLVHPEAGMTRAEAVTIFFRLLTEECRSYYWGTFNSYSDISSTAWYNNAISTMTRAGVVTGYPDGSFGANDLVTRAEMVTMVTRIVKPIRQYDAPFDDIKGHWAEQYIHDAYSIGVLNGRDNNMFAPDEPITRAEVMSMCNRMMGRNPSGWDIPEGMKIWPDNDDPDAWYYLDVQEATNSHTHMLIDGNDPYRNKERWIKFEENMRWELFERPDYTIKRYYRSDTNT